MAATHTVTMARSHLPSAPVGTAPDAVSNAGSGGTAPLPAAQPYRPQRPGAVPLQGPQQSVRCYSGEHQSHAHDHVQILYALQGRMELELDGHAAYVDAASGMLIPAGAAHGYLAQPGTQVQVIDVPAGMGLDRGRRFAVPTALRAPALAQRPISAAAQLALVLEAPSLLHRRTVDLAWLTAQVQAALHADWPSARLAGLCHLSVPQFHARFVELTGVAPQAWLRGLRLDAAVAQLAQGQLLETTALRCGYRTASALAYALRRERQVSARGLRAAPR